MQKVFKSLHYFAAWHLCENKKRIARKVGKAQRIGNYFFAAWHLCESLIIPCRAPRRTGQVCPLVRACPDAYREGVARIATLRLCVSARKKIRRGGPAILRDRLQSREGAKNWELFLCGLASLRELNNPLPCAEAYGTGMPPCKSLSRCISGGSCPNCVFADVSLCEKKK